jgi:hypothetical protein
MLWATETFAAEEILEGQPAPYGGALVNDSELAKILLTIQTLPIVEEERINLINQVNTLKDTCGNTGEQVANLNQQIDKYKQLLEIEQARTTLEHDRGEFYKEQGVAKDKLVDQYAALNEKLLKEAEKKTFWKSLAIGEILLTVGLIVGLAL